MKEYCLPAAALLLLGCHSAFATELELDPVIVTATRTAQTADETLAAVTVITRKDIERLQAQSVQDVLRGLPGVNITNNGGAGRTTSVFLRGAESDHVLVLVDGIRVGSATLGTTAFQHIPVEQIERIEIVRGPRSSLYGSEAIGGVIQIFTRKGGGALKPFFSVGGGSYDTYNASAGVSGGGEHGWFNLSASGISTKGFNACDGRPEPGGAGCFTTEADKDGYRNLSGSLRAGYRFDNGVEMDAHVLHATGDTEFDGSFVNESETVQQVLGATLRYSPMDIWQLTLVMGRSQDESDNFIRDASDNLRVFQTRFDTERDTLSLQNDLSIATDHLLTVGADYQDDRIDGTTPFAVTSRDNTGLFTQYQGAFGAHDVQLSARRDDNEQFSIQNTGGAAWGYALSDGLRLTASYGTAFKAPTFNELYFPDFGNANLRPEESRSVEIGLGGKTAWGRWSLHTYETRVDDLIASDSGTSPVNINQARIRGLEAVLGTRLGNWDLNTNLTLLDPENRSGADNDGNVLPRRVRQSLRLDADRDFGQYRLGATLLAAGKRYDDLDNTRELGGYTTLDVRTEYVLTKNWRVQARVENLLDKDYETVAFFNQPGRSLFVTLRYQP
ncbi:MAG: TonB-dependent vitamin B12 receptor [Gammaproteobacteria bacterium]|nr:MAG: TonB-dependent vitamin B12 receptor [Gammaproteobacteria bacterium]